LALGVSKGDATVMERDPRDPKESILTRNHWLRISGYSFVITLVVLGAFGLAGGWLNMPTQQMITVSFLTLAFSQLWHVFNMRDRGSNLFNNDVVKNPYIWGALALCILLLLTAVYIPPVANVLMVVDPGLKGWGVILGMSLIPLLLGQIYKQIDLFG
jgi:Ca2+-transporting ATPase